MTHARVQVQAVQRCLTPGHVAVAAELGEKASATVAACGVPVAAVPVAAKRVEQAVQHYSCTWLIAAVAAEVATRALATLAALFLSPPVAP